jgi:hypothetical protein
MGKLTFISHALHYGSGAHMQSSWQYVVISCSNIMTLELKYGPTLSYKWQI